jgi:hypothetical protein
MKTPNATVKAMATLPIAELVGSSRAECITGLIVWEDVVVGC